MNGVIIAVSSSLAVSVVVKATLIMVAGLIGAWLARARRAAVRHAVLAASFAVLLVLPMASILAPPVRIAVATAVAPIPFEPARVAISPGLSADVAVGASRAIPRSSGFSPAALLLVGWIVGAVLFLMRMIVGLQQVHSLRQFGIPCRSAQVMVDALAPDAGIYRRVEVLLHESLVAPVTCGVFHPAIVLPPDAENWDGEDLERALVHELEHVRRCDWMIHCFSRVACSAYWFHPLVWIAWRRLALEAERSCDDAVLRGSEATAYADQLVGLAQRLSAGKKSPALAMANRSDLSARVRAVLDSRQRRGRAGAILVAVACAVAAIVVMAVSPLRMVAAPQAASAQPAASAPAFEVASVKAWPSGRVGGVTIQYSADSITLRGIDLWIGLTVAYGLRDFQISGPERLKMAPAGSGNRYDILAKASGPVSNDQLRMMLRTLLAERFHMAMHREKREMPVFALIVAKGGPRFHPTPPGTEVDSQFLGFANVRDQPDVRGGHSFTNAPIAALAAALSAIMPFAPEPVIDMTELPGRYDFVLHEVPRPRSDGPPNFDDMIAAQKTIVQDELGLTWERRKAPVDVLVVDHADKTPTDN